MERWNRKKEELKHESDFQTEQEMAKSEYADLSALACLLCQRKFKQKSDLERHQAISELHKVRDHVQHIHTQISKCPYCCSNTGKGGRVCWGGGEGGRGEEQYTMDMSVSTLLNKDYAFFID